MASRKKGLGPVKRFGPRYGRTLKVRLAKIEVEQKKDHTCPFCAKDKVSRVAAGIWYCKKCESKFAAKAYTVGQKTALVEETVQFVAEAPKLRVKPVVEEE